MSDPAPNPSNPTNRLSGGYVAVDPVTGITTFHEPPIQIHNPDDLIAPATDNPAPARVVPACDRGVKILTPPPFAFADTKVRKGSGKQPTPANGKNRPPKRK